MGNIYFYFADITVISKREISWHVVEFSGKRGIRQFPIRFFVHGFEIWEIGKMIQNILCLRKCWISPFGRKTWKWYLLMSNMMNDDENPQLQVWKESTIAIYWILFPIINIYSWQFFPTFSTVLSLQNSPPNSTPNSRPNSPSNSPSTVRNPRIHPKDT